MTNETERDRQGDLDAFFADARQQAPSADLVSRVLADAAAVPCVAQPKPVRSVRTRGWLARAVSAVGGWPGASGVVMAGVAGLALGLTAPDLVDGWSGGQIWSLSGGAGVTPDIGTLWAEAGDV